MKFTSPKSRSFASVVIDLTPLIDIVFLLLLFFLLTTAPTPDPTLNVSLPKVENAGIDRVSEHIDITVKLDGTVYLVNVPVKMESLEKELREISKNVKGMKVVLRADGKIYYETFMRILETVNKLNLPLAVAVDEKNIEKK